MMPRYTFTQEDSRKGGKALVEKRGRQHMSKIGRRGFAATVKKHWDGDTEAMTDWLAKKGRWAIDKDLSYAKPEIFGDPGPHPAHDTDDCPF